MKVDEVRKLDVNPYTAHQVVTARRAATAAAMTGFTIIEVMIVLAVAAVILLIVLLAVPAFQRGQRNTARKQDVARVISAVARYYSNSNAFPSTTAAMGNVITDVGNFGGYSNMAAAPTIGTAASNKISYVASTTTVAALGTGLTDAMQVVSNAVCTVPQDGSATSTGAITKNFVIQYTLETGTAGTSGVFCSNGS